MSIAKFEQEIVLQNPKDGEIMQEHIYTIPVNEAFEDESDKCPFCLLHEKLQEDELTLILGASMMEPDVRIQTNEKGFCKEHFAKLLLRGNRLGLALILESHLEELKSDVKLGGMLSRDKTAAPKKKLAQLENSCYICDRVEGNFDAMISTAAYLYSNEEEFRKRFAAKKCLCLPHYRRLLEETAHMKKPYSQLMAADAEKIVTAYLDKLKNDISWFVKKFDYRYDDEPWYDSKDAIERSVAFLSEQ